MKLEPAFDLWDAKSEPAASYTAAVYFVKVSHEVTRGLHYMQVPSCYVEVDIYGWVTIRQYSWFGEFSSEGIKHDTTTEILNWLQEWEFVELRSIGPEDREWFATDKLLKLPKVVNYDIAP